MYRSRFEFGTLHCVLNFPQALAINEMSGLYCYGILQMDNSTEFECSNSLPEQLRNVACNW